MPSTYQDGGGDRPGAAAAPTRAWAAFCCAWDVPRRRWQCYGAGPRAGARGRLRAPRPRPGAGGAPAPATRPRRPTTSSPTRAGPPGSGRTPATRSRRALEIQPTSVRRQRYRDAGRRASRRRVGDAAAERASPAPRFLEAEPAGSRPPGRRPTSRHPAEPARAGGRRPARGSPIPVPPATRSAGGRGGGRPRRRTRAPWPPRSPPPGRSSAAGAPGRGPRRLRSRRRGGARTTSDLHLLIAELGTRSAARSDRPATRTATSCASSQSMATVPDMTASWPPPRRHSRTIPGSARPDRGGRREVRVIPAAHGFCGGRRGPRATPLESHGR